MTLKSMIVLACLLIFTSIGAMLVSNGSPHAWEILQHLPWSVTAATRGCSEKWPPRSARDQPQGKLLHSKLSGLPLLRMGEADNWCIWGDSGGLYTVSCCPTRSTAWAANLSNSLLWQSQEHRVSLPPGGCRVGSRATGAHPNPAPGHTPGTPPRRAMADRKMIMTIRAPLSWVDNITEGLHHNTQIGIITRYLMHGTFFTQSKYRPLVEYYWSGFI